MMSTSATRIGWGVAIACSACIFSLKIFTRIKFVGGLKPDDYLAALAFASLVTGMGFTFVMLDLGLAQPQAEYILLPEVSKLLKYFYISDQLYIFGILFNKLSLIFLYKRITRSAATLRRLNHFLTALAVFVFVFSMGLFVVDLFWCRPIKAFWSWMPFPRLNTYCDTKYINNTVYVWQGFNITSDLLIMLIPYFLISAAALPHRSQLLALYFLFSLSILVLISSIIKIVGIARSFEPYSLVLWSIIEGNVAMCVACLPSLPPLLWRTARLSCSYGNSGGSSHGTRRSFGVKRDIAGGLNLNLNLGGFGYGGRGAREDMSIIEIDTARLDRKKAKMEDDLEMGDMDDISASLGYETEGSIRHIRGSARSSC